MHPLKKEKSQILEALFRGVRFALHGAGTQLNYVVMFNPVWAESDSGLATLPSPPGHAPPRQTPESQLLLLGPSPLGRLQDATSTPSRVRIPWSFSISSNKRRALPFGTFRPDSQASTVLFDTPQSLANAR